MPWSTAFDDPVRVSNKRKLLTLQEAADYIMELPEDAQHEAHWQTAIETLINAAETGGGWVMFARIAMLRALNTDGRRG
ncbi:MULTISPECIES: hypothetical protein [Bradyrhizobium]|uniref:PH domain-containing protein n=1 Tax=Bradyrhizobium yuanmingense TaxID=108015 RepID=A0A1C3TVN9_9BRAD|nr:MULTISPECIES: hypothetical protein [Bradyrhizobium]MCA1468817.1 hypothetical protein [Bradyrhizobium sp. IC3195]MCA1496295.1 hypothetical protein [Bradyrhizobium sp. NBAIM14]MCA1533218.1 hypothetical protein [Bradyrhizobium sp. NBAIM03]TWI30775.1 hypothetical protein IQ15_01671 [Bradyrhizobium yuanmingense]SCB07310.1 hypothetical protein GA0061099_100189 [Bradyrhizobium yuanmingense]